MNAALVIVDVQHDFLPGGALGVPRGDEVLAPIAGAARSGRFAVVVASRDAHPEDHCSFAAQGGPWPVHCVDGEHGGELHPLIAALPLDHVVAKATTAEVDAYSALDGTGLAGWLRAHRIDTVVVTGLATDYCVRATARDALAAGFHVIVPRDAVRAVDVAPGDGERALAELAGLGVEVVDRVADAAVA